MTSLLNSRRLIDRSCCHACNVAVESGGAPGGGVPVSQVVPGRLQLPCGPDDGGAVGDLRQVSRGRRGGGRVGQIGNGLGEAVGDDAGDGHHSFGNGNVKSLVESARVQG